MAYRYRSGYKARKLAKQSRRNFLVSLILVGLLLYATITWILPALINSIGFVKDQVKPQQKVETVSSKNSSLPPPVLNIPYEATNSAEINIKGYGTANSKVAIFLDDEKKDIVDVSSDGTFEFVNIPLVLGTNNIYGKSIDEEDLESLPSKTLKVIYDNEKPLLNLTEPEDGKTIQGGDRKVKIAGNTEVGAQIFINDSQTIVDKDGNFSLEQILNDGENVFNIQALDKALNFQEISRRVTYNPS